MRNSGSTTRAVLILQLFTSAGESVCVHSVELCCPCFSHPAHDVATAYVYSSAKTGRLHGGAPATCTVDEDRFFRV